ncbi:unnamed protein product, partial [Rhizoctonia solani]
HLPFRSRFFLTFVIDFMGAVFYNTIQASGLTRPLNYPAFASSPSDVGPTQSQATDSPEHVKQPVW